MNPGHPDTEPISSLDNPQVRLGRSLLDVNGRRRHRAFLVEGLRLVEEAVSVAVPRLVFYRIGFGQRDGRERSLLRRLRVLGVPLRLVTERVLSSLTDTVTPQGIVAVIPLPLEASVREGVPLTLVLDAVADPGNAGTLLRSAAGAGATALVAMRGTVDLFSPKVVRAGAGAHFYLPLATGLAWDQIAAHLPPGGQVLLAESDARMPYWAVDWTRPSTLIVGNEAHGASEPARELARASVAIPLRDVESLNVGVAGSVILFEAARQRAVQDVRPVPG